MKRFPRLLRLLSLLLVSIVWSSGLESLAVAQKELPPGSPAILSFTATPSTILKGDASVLRWQVSNAEHIWISIVERPDSADCVRQASGEMRVTPERATTYKLHVWGRNIHILREVTVQVNEPSGFCTISGEIRNYKTEYATTVGLYATGSAQPLFSTPVNSNGDFGFSRVPEGNYQVIPKGRYPDGKLAIGPIPRSYSILCRPNGSHRVHFRIGSNEG
jgi:hypothetical protein